jgi:hypothetical protein
MCLLKYALTATNAGPIVFYVTTKQFNNIYTF